MIPEPQKTYVLELLAALGPAADSFVVAGAQAMKFHLRRARATKDVDFVLDAVKLRASPLPLAQTLRRLGYTVIPESRNFQFQKLIPGSPEVMRIEFMAPEDLKRSNDFRVDIQAGTHARACTGGAIALAESKPHQLNGNLPDGSAYTAQVRVTESHALVMLKLLALDDRYQNLRGISQAAHDRSEAQTHAADIIAILSAQADLTAFRFQFLRQMDGDLPLKARVTAAFTTYFRDGLAPGFLLYEESLAANAPLGDAAGIQAEIERAVALAARVLAPSDEDDRLSRRLGALHDYSLQLTPIIPAEHEIEPFRLRELSSQTLTVTKPGSDDCIAIPLAGIRRLFADDTARRATLQLDGRVQWITGSPARGFWKFFPEKPNSAWGVGRTWGSHQAPVANARWAQPQNLAAYRVQGWEPYYGPDGRYFVRGRLVLIVKVPES